MAQVKLRERMKSLEADRKLLQDLEEARKARWERRSQSGVEALPLEARAAEAAPDMSSSFAHLETQRLEEERKRRLKRSGWRSVIGISPSPVPAGTPSSVGFG